MIKRALILVIGQSNIANHGAFEGGAFEYTPKHSVHYYNGKSMEVFTSPIGDKPHMASGNASTMLPYLGDLVIEQLDYEEVIFINIAVGGTTVDQWIPNVGKYERNIVGDDFKYENGLFERVIEAHKIAHDLGYEFTHILWHQGEDDNIKETSTGSYKNDFLKIKKGIRDLAIMAPIYMARASWTSAGAIAKRDNNILNAQTQLINENPDILDGPNTDIIDVKYRYDGSHFNKEGLIKHANLWIKYLK